MRLFLPKSEDYLKSYYKFDTNFFSVIVRNEDVTP